MGAMQVTIANAGSHQRIVMVRDDGTRMETTFPHKGPFPHDAVHFVVERELGLRRGFWGTVAGGCHPEEVNEIAKAAGHASAKRAEVPEPHIVELLQAERIVECFEAEIWSGPGDPETLRGVIAAACSASHVPVIELDDATIAAIHARLATMAEDWRGGTLSFIWDEADGE